MTGTEVGGRVTLSAIVVDIETGAMAILPIAGLTTIVP